ncbi:hypothetical protein D3C86_1176990 [compost metagenome]
MGHFHGRQPVNFRQRLQPVAEVALGAGAPETPQPGCDLRRIGRRHAERAERIEQPARCFFYDAGSGNGYDFGESQNAGIAGTRPPGNLAALQKHYLASGILQIKRRHGTDNAGADHQHIAFQGFGHRRSCNTNLSTPP